MKCSQHDRDPNFRWPDFVRNELLYALAEANEAKFKKILFEHFKWGSTNRHAEILNIPVRTLRRIHRSESKPSFENILKIFADLRKQSSVPLAIVPKLTREETSVDRAEVLPPGRHQRR